MHESNQSGMLMIMLAFGIDNASFTDDGWRWIRCSGSTDFPLYPCQASNPVLQNQGKEKDFNGMSGLLWLTIQWG